MSGHGDYKRMTHAEVRADAEARDYTIVSADSMVFRGSGRALEVLHIVAAPNFWAMDVPVGYNVELLRPIWLYGNEGTLSELEFIARLSDDYLDALAAGVVCDGDDPFPECADFIWALPNRKYNLSTKTHDSVPWREVDWEWWKSLQSGAEATS